jgi:thermitase
MLSLRYNLHHWLDNQIGVTSTSLLKLEKAYVMLVKQFPFRVVLFSLLLAFFVLLNASDLTGLSADASSSTTGSVSAAVYTLQEATPEPMFVPEDELITDESEATPTQTLTEIAIDDFSPTATSTQAYFPTALPFPTLPLVAPSTQVGTDQSDSELQLPIPTQVVLTFSTEMTVEERKAYVTERGGEIVAELNALNALVAVLPMQALSLDGMPDAETLVTVEPDYFVSAQLEVPPNDPLYSDQWALPAIGAANAWAALPVNLPTVVVAIIDSGVCLEHPDLQGRVLPGWDFVDGDAIPQDEMGHGCGAAGIIAANINNGVGIAGVAPNAMVMPLRVLNAQGSGTYSNVAAAIVYAADHSAQIINLSLGGTYASTLLENAVNYAVGLGVTVVAAAGNTGSEQILYPAAYEPVISVGAVDQNLLISNFSARGSGIDILAPGQNILTTRMDQSFTPMTGTSFAAPFVSAAAALDLAIGIAQAITLDGGLLNLSNSIPPTATATATPVSGRGDFGMGLYNPANAVWMLRDSLTNGEPNRIAVYGGIAGALPVVGDWNGDGSDTMGMYVPNLAYWFLRNSNTTGTGDIFLVYGGISGAVPVVGDWNGDGVDTIGLYNLTTGMWYLRNSNTNGEADVAFLYGGIPGAVPVAGDWNGDGIDTVGLYVPATALWLLRNSNTGGQADVSLVYGGISGGVPVVGDWDSNGTDTIGIYVPNLAYWFLRNSNTTGTGQIFLVYGGINGAPPVVGRWG